MADQVKGDVAEDRLWQEDGSDLTVDWDSIEERHGPIPQEERNRIEVDVLRQESDAAVNQADWTERMYEQTKAEIQEAAAAGQTHGDYMAAQQGDYMGAGDDADGS